MADSKGNVPFSDTEFGDETSQQQQKSKSAAEIPNYRGKVVEAPEGEGMPTVTWDDDDSDDSDDETDDEIPEGAVGEEFGKARKEAARLRREKRRQEEEDSDEEVVEEHEKWNFPVDEDEWDEYDIGEEWADAWDGDENVGFDPDLIEDMDEVLKQWREGRGPPVRPYYVPYRKHYPLVPEDHFDIQTPRDVVEELERIEEYLTWASFIFEDGSSYEGTVWDDVAQGRGVYTSALDLCRYEGEWVQNAMEGHGVLEVDIPTLEPAPDSEEAKKWKAEGKLLVTDYMDEKDKEWLKMEVEDALLDEDAIDPNPIEESNKWVKRFGRKPYAGQWKHNRMHGCGLYEVNGRSIYGKFYFGEMLPYPGECDAELVGVHSSMAEIAAGKARMFVNKPDGMVREKIGPYTDPSHPYMYEEEDLWMAPGFINEFYPVPELWQRYVEEVDEEQEMWLNSFIKSPFRIPMPPELEYLWQQNDEFVVLSHRDPDPMQQDPANLAPGQEGEILLHLPTGRLINWTEDPEGNLRFFYQPYCEDGKVDPELAVPLPLGFDEFMGEVDSEGNVIPVERRHLPLKERQKLEEEDKRKEKLKRDREEVAKYEAKELGKIKLLEEELRVKELEDELEDLILEEKFIAQLEAAAPVPSDNVDREDEVTEVPENGADEKVKTMKTSVEVNGDGTPEIGKKGDADRFEPLEVFKEGDDDKAVGEKSGSEDEGDDEDEGDEKRPRSFGKVAWLFPEKDESCAQQVKEHPPPSFPSVFASISMLTQSGIRGILSSSLSNLRSGWSFRCQSPRDSSSFPPRPVKDLHDSDARPRLAPARVHFPSSSKLSSSRLCHTTKGATISLRKKVAAAHVLLSHFSPKRRPQRVKVRSESRE